MVNINLDHEKYQFTTENVLERFNIYEKVMPIKNSVLKFYFQDAEPYLLVNGKAYTFESRDSLVFFLQKLSLNSTLMTTLSNDVLASVVNEILGKQSTLNLVIGKNTNQILTVTSYSATLVSWRKIIKAVHELFDTLECKKILYLTTFSGLGISIIMNDVNALENPDIDVIRIEPQTPSSISIYRGIARETVSLRGYDEDEIIEILKGKLQLMYAVDPAISKNYSLVRD